MKKIITALMFAFGVVSLTASSSALTYYYPDQSTPVSGTCYSLTRDFGLGSYDYQTNGEVTKLQSALLQLGFFNQAPTGYYGNVTYTAVRNFQLANNISSTGYVGPLTRAAIQSKTCGVSTPSPTTCPSVLYFGTEYQNNDTCTCPAGYTRQQAQYQCPSGTYCPAVIKMGNVCVPTNNVCPLNTNFSDRTCVCPTGYSKTQIVYIQAGPDMWTCTPNPTTPVQTPTPVISQVSGPTVVYTNQSNTWSIIASVADNSNLTYSITWGDEGYGGYYYTGNTTSVASQSSTFTHVYNAAGTYTITIKVTSSNGKQAQTTRTVEVRSGTGSGSTICPLNTTFNDANCVCPTGYTKQVTSGSNYGSGYSSGGYTYTPLYSSYYYPTYPTTSYTCVSSTSPVAATPVISSVSGPGAVTVGQNNTWAVNASVSDNSSLSYSITWGDEGYGGYYYVPLNPTFVQTSTFTHVYNTPGTYTINITVRSSNGKQAQTTKVVTVQTGQTGATTCPINTTLSDFSSCICPTNYGKLSFIDANGATRFQCLPRSGAICPTDVTITRGNYTMGDVVNYCTCPAGYNWNVITAANPMLPDAGETGKCVTPTSISICPLYTTFTDPTCVCIGGYTKITLTSYPPQYTCSASSGQTPTQPTPVISQVSGPTVVYTNQSNTWSIIASVADNSNLTYSIKWGDEYNCQYGYCYTTTNSSSVVAQQTSTFTHAYSTPGTYTITINVISSNGKQAQTTRTVEVRSGTGTTSPVCPLNTILGYSIGNLNSQYQGCVCPTGYSQQMTGYPCPAGMYCPAVMVVMCVAGGGN